MTRASEDAKRSRYFPDPRSRFDSCPEDERTVKNLSQKESILHNVSLVTEQKYQDELTRLAPVWDLV
jgi:hypothetical protein